MTGGFKKDENKVRMDLIPSDAIWALGLVLTHGAQKYPDRNWEKGMDWGRVYAALQRHLTAWWGGESKDKESGYSHLWHALACVAFLVVYERRGIGKDTRSKLTKSQKES